MLARRIAGLKKNGFEITEVQEAGCVIRAAKKVDSGKIEVLWQNNAVWVWKPNGTVKMLYERSEAQVYRALIQTIEANTYLKWDEREAIRNHKATIIEVLERREANV